MSFSRTFIYQAVDKITPTLNKITLKTEQLSKKAAKVGQEMSSVGRNLTTKLTAPIAIMGGVSIRNFSKLEEGLTNTTNLLNSEEIKKYTSSLKNMQKQAILNGFSIEDVNKSLFDNISALGTSKEAINSYSEAQKLSVAGAAPLSATVDGLTSIINAYGRETTKANEVANALFSAQQKGKTTVAALSANIGKVAPIARQAGVGYKELLAAMATLTLGGLSTEESATALRGAIASLIKPSAEAKKVLTKLNIPFGTTQIRAKGLGNTLQMLTEASEKYPDLLAQAIPNVRAFTGVASFSTEKLKILNDIQDKINKDILNGTGLQDKYSISMEIASRKISKLKGKMTILTAEIGQRLFPVLDNIITKAIIPFINKITSWIVKNPELSKTIIKLTAALAAIGPILIGLGTLISIIAFALSPLTLTIMGVTAAIVATSIAGFYLWQQWNKIPNIFKKISSILLTLTGPFGSAINLALKLGDMAKYIVDNWKSVIDTFDSLANKFSPGGAWEGLKELIGIGEESKRELPTLGPKAQELLKTEEGKKALEKLQMEVAFKPEGAKVTGVSTKMIGNNPLGINIIGAF